MKCVHQGGGVSARPLRTRRALPSRERREEICPGQQRVGANAPTQMKGRFRCFGERGVWCGGEAAGGSVCTGGSERCDRKGREDQTSEAAVPSFSQSQGLGSGLYPSSSAGDLCLFLGLWELRIEEIPA